MWLMQYQCDIFGLTEEHLWFGENTRCSAGQECRNQSKQKWRMNLHWALRGCSQLGLVCSMKFQSTFQICLFTRCLGPKELQVNKCAHFVIWVHGVFMMFWVDLYLSYLLSEVLFILKLWLSLSLICIAAYPISGVIRIWIWRDPFPKADRLTWGLHNVEHCLKALKWEWHKNGSVRSLRFGPGRDIHPSLKPISIWVKFCIKEKHRQATAKGFPVGLPSLPWLFLAKELASIWVTFSRWWLENRWTMNMYSNIALCMDLDCMCAMFSEFSLLTFRPGKNKTQNSSKPTSRMNAPSFWSVLILMSLVLLMDAVRQTVITVFRYCVHYVYLVFP